jgi:hypothetical protein
MIVKGGMCTTVQGVMSGSFVYECVNPERLMMMNF